MHRVEVSLKSHLPDARGLGLVKDIQDLGVTAVCDVRMVDIYWLDADLPPDKLDLVCQHLLADPVTQDYQHSTPSAGIKADSSDDTGQQWHTVEVAYNAGVADPVEETVMKAIGDLSVGGVRSVKTAKRYLLQGKLDEALKVLTEAAGVTSDPVIYEHLGDVYLEQSQAEEAARWWERALELDPGASSVRRKLEALRPIELHNAVPQGTSKSEE